MSDEVDHESVYGGLLDGEVSAQWAFGTDFADPLAGLDTTLPTDIDGSVLGTYCLMLADDALIMAQRLSEWCSRAPDLEEDVALANIALDLLGQARLLLARAAAADPGLVPILPTGSPVPPEDALAFFRGERQFRNVRLVEIENGDFGRTVVRLLLFATWRLAILQRLRASRDRVLSALAAKAVKEVTYHRDFAARWFLTLAQGTGESRRRVCDGLSATWPLLAELMDTHPVEREAASSGVGVDPAEVIDEVDAVLDEVFAASALGRPESAARVGVRGRRGRDGTHTEALSLLLAEMQVVARAHPLGRW